MNLATWRKSAAVALRKLEALPLRIEALLLLFVAFTAAGSRLLFVHLLPTYIWSKDGGSYAHGAFAWLDSGEWLIDGRRGPVYTMFLGYATRLWGSFDGIMLTQHALEFVAIIFTVICARIHFGRRQAWLIYACGYALSINGSGLYYGHLVRNESLLFFFASIAVGSWALALKKRSAGWLALGGMAAGFLTLTKNVLLPFPIIALAGVAYLFWRNPRRLVGHAAAFIAAFALPFALVVWHDKTASVVEKPQPQSGILLFGRTAQWTALDGGIEPELKALIRADIEEYRKRAKLDNNIILKRTAVPHLWEHLQQEGRTAVDLNRLCRRLAVEAISTHPKEFFRQVIGDFLKIHFAVESTVNVPDPSELKSAGAILAGIEEPHPSLQIPRTLAAFEIAEKRGHFNALIALQKSAWLFRFFPALATSLGGLWLVWRSRAEERLFWLGHAAIWSFTLVLLCTVGRPLNRYLLPALPIMFWTLTALVVAAVGALSKKLAAVREAAPAQASP